MAAIIGSMKPFTRHTRVSMGAALVVALAADIWWITHRPTPEMQQFSLAPTATAFKFSDEEQFPRYEPSARKWTLHGKHLGTLTSVVARSDGTPDGIGAFVIVRVNESASVSDVRQTLNALIDEGICQAGIVDQASRDEGGMREVLVFRIDWVLDEFGAKHHCKPKVS